MSSCSQVTFTPASNSMSSSSRLSTPLRPRNRPLFVEPRMVPPWLRMPEVFLLFVLLVRYRIDEPFVAS